MVDKLLSTKIIKFIQIWLSRYQPLHRTTKDSTWVIRVLYPNHNQIHKITLGMERTKYQPHKIWRKHNLFEKYENGFSEPMPSEVEPYIPVLIGWRCQSSSRSIPQLYLAMDWTKVQQHKFKLISSDRSNDVSTTQNLNEDWLH